MNQRMTPRNYASRNLFKTVGASELTGQDIDIAHLVQSGSDFGPNQLSVNLFEDWRRKML